MKRLLLLLVAVALAGTLRAAIPSPAAKPNVILFLVDDMGWVDCGAYGSTYYKTPNMDRFATQALRFTDAYAQPLCSPTRCCLLTGKAAARHGLTNASGHRPPQPPGHDFMPQTAPVNRPMIMPESKNYMEPSEYTLAEALRDGGWRTAHIGKWHLGLTAPHWPDQQGFEVAIHAHPDPGPPSYFSPYGFKYQSYPDGPPGEYITDRLTEEAVKFITENKDRPFFLNLWHHGVHGPWGHKVAYTQAYAKTKDPRGLQGNPIMASMLQSVDESLGRVVETLDRLHLTENTIFIFNSDNGGNTHSNIDDEGEDAKGGPTKKAQLDDWHKWAGDLPPTNNAPLRAGKGTLYEGGVRVPLMWSWPGHIAPGKVTAEVVGAIDLYPTILDLLHLPKNQEQIMDGLSYAPVLSGTGSVPSRPYFNFYPHGAPGKPGGATVRVGDWKLIRWFETGPDYPSLHELYNLRDDLGETKNLAEAQPDRVHEMDALLTKYFEETHALLPKPNPAYKPRPAAAARVPKAGLADPLQNWKPKNCDVSFHDDGTLVLQPTGQSCFLGTAQVKHAGAALLTARLRCPAGGPGRVQWRTSEQDTFPETGQIVNYQLPANPDWQEVKVPVPAEGQVVQFRFFVPGPAPIEIASLVYASAKDGKPAYTWSFRKAATP